MATNRSLTSDSYIESLTRRELDVLALLAENLSDREIADRLTFALSSVKWYTRQVYTKLGVDNRRQAVAKARELGWFEAGHSSSLPAHNLPRQLTRLIGREKEIAQVVEMVWEHPLVTLTGPGGVGKTRLALAVGEELLEDFPNGIWFIEFAALRDPLMVVTTIANTLKVAEEPGRPLLETLIDNLTDRHALLILDNCEHLVDASASVVNDFLRTLPGLKILVSGREPLGVSGEAIFRVPSLSFPRDGQIKSLDSVVSYEALRLFQDRTRAVLPGFELTFENVRAVAQICRRLDGIPLAIELAASCMFVLDLEQIAARLDQAFRFLSGGSRNALERQRTLRATIDWSYNLLTEKERLLLCRLSIFVGGWSLPASEAVCAGEGLEKEEILDLLFQLANKSMVVVDHSPDAEVRYHLLETIRQYSEEKLDGLGEGKEIRNKHLRWFLRFAESAEPKLYTNERLVWEKKLVTDLDNIRAALDWSLNQRSNPLDGLKIVNALAIQFWYKNMYQAEGRRWLEISLAELANDPVMTPALEARSLYNKAWLECSIHLDAALLDQILELCQQSSEETMLVKGNALSLFGFCNAMNDGNLRAGLALLNEGEAILRQLGEAGKWSLALCLMMKPWVLGCLNDQVGAFACAEESSALFHEVGDVWFGMDIPLGDAAYRRGDYELAYQIYKNAIAFSREMEEWGDVADKTRKLGDVLRAQQQFSQAYAAYRESLKLNIENRNTDYIVWLLCCFAFTEVDWAQTLSSAEAKPHFLRSAMILGANQCLNAEMRMKVPIEYQPEYDQKMVILRENLEAGILRDAWAEGLKMGLENVEAYVMKDQ